MDLFRGFVKVLKQSRTKPAVHFQLWTMVPITEFEISSPKVLELELCSWEGNRREHEQEALVFIFKCQVFENVYDIV